MPSPVGYGWKRCENNEMEINWGSQPPAPEDVLELFACCCSRACRQSQCNCLQTVYPVLAHVICLTVKTSQRFIILMKIQTMSVITMTKVETRTNESVFM